MKIRKVTRYYCDHCGKGRFHKNAAQVHEWHCTANPNRACRLCNNPSPDMKELTAIVDNMVDFTEEEMMQRLSDAVESCPACILAAIRQSEAFNFKPGPDEERHYFTFNYKEAHEEYWKQKREDEALEFRHGF